MVLLRIKLEKGEKIPTLFTSRQKNIPCKCPNCEERFEVYLHGWKEEKWISGECWFCGYRFILTPKQCELIQPSSPFFEVYYGFHPEKEAEKQAKVKRWGEDQRKVGLEEKYNRAEKDRLYGTGRLHPWDIKKIKQIVLEGKDYGHLRGSTSK